MPQIKVTESEGRAEKEQKKIIKRDSNQIVAENGFWFVTKELFGSAHLKIRQQIAGMVCLPIERFKMPRFEKNESGMETWAL